MQHPDILLFLAKDRMETLQREARIDAAYRRARTASRASSPEPPSGGFFARLRWPALLRLARS